MDTTLELKQTDFLTNLHESTHRNYRKIEIALRIIEALGASLIVSTVALQLPSITLAITGAALIVCVEVALLALDLLGICKIDPKNHAFREMKINHSSIYYEGNLPVVKIRANTHKDAGFDYGFLTAPQILKVIKRLNILVQLGYISITKEIKQQLEKVKSSVPEHHLDEIKGMVEGANLRLNEDSFWPSKVTFEDVVTLHMLPDLMHLALAPNCLFGCSVVTGKDEKTNKTGVARLLDWPALGIGDKSCLINIKVGEEKQLLLPSFPGCVGAITGVNKRLFCSINVTEPKEAIYDISEGVPSLFLNRLVLENCEKVKDVQEYIDYKNPQKRPAVPYHMFVADDNDAEFYHFLQGDQKETFRRPIPHDDSAHFTLNCRHTSTSMPEKPNTMYYGESRYENIYKVWEQTKELPLVERLKKVMKAPGVNNPMTVQAVMKMETTLVFSWDNSFAANADKNVIFLDQEFEN